MEGIRFLIDEQGEKTAVQIDLVKYGEFWEDIYDSLIAQERQSEPRESLDEVKECLRQQGKRIDSIA